MLLMALADWSDLTEKFTKAMALVTISPLVFMLRIAIS